MAFEIVELKKETFTGNKVEIPEFDPQKGFGPMSEIKESAYTKFAKNEKDYVGINASLDGLQYYIVASGENGDTTFDIPEGKYAKFVTSETDRPALAKAIQLALRDRLIWRILEKLSLRFIFR
ncbi:Serine protease HTRA1 [Listeria monocytogenes]|nr:Serine protease HTRA1 [Listeria monocytogenes]